MKFEMDRYLIKTSKPKPNKDFPDPIHEQLEEKEVSSAGISASASSDFRPSVSAIWYNYESDSEGGISDGSDIMSNDANSNNNHTPKNRKRYKQQFREDWRKRYSWLDNVNGQMCCKVCNVLLSGSRFHLGRHENSKNHFKKFNAAIRTPAILSYVEKISNDNLSLTKQIQRAEYKLCVYLCEKNLPFRLMDDLPQVLTDIFPDSTIAKSIKMKRTKATKTVINKLGPTAESQILDILKKNYFSLIVDESTDISTQKSLVLVARVWDNESHKVCDRFLSLIKVEKCTAEGLFKTIHDFLEEHLIPFRNIIGFGADNASVMMGGIKGLQTLLKSISPNIIVQGCSCHSLNLCANHASKKLPSTVEQFLKDVYSHFSRSASRSKLLQEFEVLFNEKETKILYLCDTRWLSREMVVNRVLEHWTSLTGYFERVSGEADASLTTKSIYNALKNPIYQMYLFFLSYILELITKINRIFQSEDPKIPILLEKIKILYKSVLKSFIKKDVIDGEKIVAGEKKKTELHKINMSNPHDYLPLEKMYFGAKADALQKKEIGKISKADLHNFRLRCLDFLIELAKQIKARFDLTDKVLLFASNFTPAVAVSGDVMSIAEFSNFFPYVKADPEKVNTEWQLLSELAEFKNLFERKVTLVEFWANVGNCKNDLGEPMFSNLMKLVKVVLSLPHSSATAERVFSQLSLIKSKTRNKLKVSSCSSLLHVKQSVNTAGSTVKWNPPIKIITKNLVSEKDRLPLLPVLIDEDEESEGNEESEDEENL